MEVNGHSRMDSTGFPEVPILSFLVAIPECDNVNISVELLDSVKISDINIYPLLRNEIINELLIQPT